MSPCRFLKSGDICDKCGQGIMRPAGRRFFLQKKVGEEYRPTQDFIELECDKCGHKHFSLELFEYLITSD